MNKVGMLTAEIHGLEVDVYYTYCPPCKGSVDSTGFQLEPDEPEEWTLDSVLTPHGDEIVDILSQRIVDQIIKSIRSSYE